MILAIKRIICILVSLINIYSISNVAPDSFWNFAREDSREFVQTADVSLAVNSK